MEVTGYKRTFKQVLDVWVIPEIMRRKEKGALSKNFILLAAQVIFPSPYERKGLEIRLNKEVKAMLKIKPNRKIKKGELVYAHDIEKIESVQLPEDEPNSAHITLLRLQNKWFLGFDSRYNKQRAKQHLEVAKQFVDLTKIAYQKEYWNASTDMLFSAIELLVKAELLLMPDPKINSHKAIQMKYSHFVNLGNAKIDYKSALNKLSALRDAARYLKSPLEISSEEIQKYINIAEEMEKYVESRIA